MVRWLGERKAMLVGFSAGAVANVIFGAAATSTMYLVGIPFASFFGLAFPSLQGLMTRRVGPEEHGRLQGAIASLGGFAGVIAPLLFTGVFALAHRAGPGLVARRVPYFLATAPADRRCSSAAPPRARAMSPTGDVVSAHRSRFANGARI